MQLHLQATLVRADALAHAEREGIKVGRKHPFLAHTASGEIEAIQPAVEQQECLAPALQAGDDHLTAPAGHLPAEPLEPQGRMLPDGVEQQQPKQASRDRQQPAMRSRPQTGGTPPPIGIALHHT